MGKECGVAIEEATLRLDAYLAAREAPKRMNTIVCMKGVEPVLFVLGDFCVLSPKAIELTGVDLVIGAIVLFCLNGDDWNSTPRTPNRKKHDLNLISKGRRRRAVLEDVLKVMGGFGCSEESQKIVSHLSNTRRWPGWEKALAGSAFGGFPSKGK